MSKVISLAEVRKDKLEQFCNKYNWAFPLHNYDLNGLMQELPLDEVEYYCNTRDTVLLCTRDLETGNSFR